MVASLATKSTLSRPESGPIPIAAGIGLRFQHHQLVVDTSPEVSWLEVHTENYMGGGKASAYLDAIRRNYPLSLHGVGLSLGSAEGLDDAHLERIRAVVQRFEPGFVSEHLAWNVADGNYLADLLPLPLTEEALGLFCRNVDETQAYLKRRILIENPSSYLQFRHSSIPEWEFLATVSQRTGCGILCDVNNIYVSACNHHWDASAYLETLPAEAVGEIHLAGHAVRHIDGEKVLRIDDHGSRVAPAVWALYAQALARFGPVPTLIEWDTDVPALDVLIDEAALAQAHLDRIQEGDANAVAT